MRYAQFGLYFVCIILGFLARRGGALNSKQALRVSWWTGWVIYPAMAFAAVTSSFTRETLIGHWILPVAEFGIMLFGALVAMVLVKQWKFPSKKVRGTFGFDFTIGNYVFLPLPLALFLWGPEGAANVVVASLGAEIPYWTIGVAFLDGKFHWKKFFTPALLALLLAFTEVMLSHPSIHQGVMFLNRGLSLIGSLTIPLAMFLLGFHLAGAVKSKMLSKHVMVVTAFRALIVPLAFLLVMPWLPLTQVAKQVLFLVATMPVAVASVYMSDIFGGDPEFAAKCVLVGHAISVITVPLWLMLVIF